MNEKRDSALFLLCSGLKLSKKWNLPSENVVEPCIKVDLVFVDVVKQIFSA